MLAQKPQSTCCVRYCNSLINRTNYPLCINRRNDRQLPSRMTVRAQQQAPNNKQKKCAQTFELPTIFAAPEGLPTATGELKANVVFPSLKVHKKGDGQKGDAPVRVWPRGGVVLFMHGFAQGPTAYARMLTQLASECDVLVVAPCPPFGATLNKQQSAMVDAALVWRNLIATNTLPGIIIAPDEGSSASSSTSSSSSPSSSSASASCPLPVGLLAHSVGGGLAPYVVDTAARKGQPFKSVHVMAPQTGLVVCKYRYQSIKTDGKPLVPSAWAVQYGCLDLLSPAFTVAGLRHWLEGRGALRSTDTVKYELGTHVGFEDQLVVDGESFTAGVLPWLLAPLPGTPALLLLALGLGVLTVLAGKDDKDVGASAGRLGKADSVPGDIVQPGFGVPDQVVLPDEWSMLISYVVLAATFTAAAVLLLPYDWQWDSPGAWMLSALKAIVTLLAVFAWPNILVYPYEAIKQRPEARSHVVDWFRKTMAADVPPAAARRAAAAAAAPAGGQPAGAAAGAVTATTAAAAAAAVALSYGIITVVQSLH